MKFIHIGADYLLKILINADTGGAQIPSTSSDSIYVEMPNLSAQ